MLADSVSFDWCGCVAHLEASSCDALSGTKQRCQWLLSQSHFGWPCNRPRLYTILVRRSVARLREPGLALIERLYRTLSMSAKQLLVAPQDF